MTFYNLRTNQSSPDLPFTIIKFDKDLNPESSYSVGQSACSCPAGHLPKCRHRTMLPNLRQRVDSAWFWNFETKSWEDPTGEAQKHQEVEEHDAATGGLDVPLHEGTEVDEGLVSDTSLNMTATEVDERIAEYGATPKANKPAPSANLAQGFRRRL